MNGISVIGCGFVGLSLAAVIASKDFDVIAADIDENKVNQIKNRNAPFFEPNLKNLLDKTVNQNLLITTDLENVINKTDLTFVTVGTPSNPDGSSNLSYLESAVKTIAKSLRKKERFHSVVIKSTVIPTTTNSIIKPILEKESEKKVGVDIGLSMNPEFLREGSSVYDTEHPHLIVIGTNENKSAEILESFYKDLYEKDLPEVIKTNIETAELIKYANNAFLATKISFINTIANICQKIPGTEVNTIASAIGKDPRIGSPFLRAGPGYGGSCFPKDLNALINFSRKIGYDPLLINATQEVNKLQATKVVELVKQSIGDLKGKTIAVLGLAFKKDTDDIRESVSIRVIDYLINEGAIIFVHDPMAIENTKKIFGSKIAYCDNIEDCLENSDCCLVMTDWDDYKKLDQNSFKNMKDQVIVDARLILDKTKFNSDVKFVAIGSS